MKNAIPVFLILSVLIICIFGNAIAEDFSVRNGVHFGMTTDELIAVENQNGNTELKQREGYHKNTTELYISNISVAGIDQGTIWYYFGPDKLNQICYSWIDQWWRDFENNRDFQISNDANERIKFENYAETIANSMAEKYDRIGYLSNKNKVTILNLQQDDDSDIYGPVLFGPSENDWMRYDIIHFSQYLAKDGENYVEITVQCYRSEYHGMTFDYTEDAQNVKYNLEVNYRSRSKELIESIVKDANEREKQRNSDL